MLDPRTPRRPVRPLALIVLDGWGLAEPGPGNAITLAKTPRFDAFWTDPTVGRARLDASGPSVGLPEGQMGNSEVGHMNLGAGRIVPQSLGYLSQLIASGAMAHEPAFEAACDAATGRTLHLIGLVSRGGVHSHVDHLLGLVDLAVARGVTRIRVHAFTDGRDAPPDAGLSVMAEVEAHLASVSADARVATVVGRYFAMDRDHRWERTKRAYDAVVDGVGDHVARAGRDAVAAAYARGETDEFVLPTVVVDDDGPTGRIADGDAAILFNFRADRMRQLLSALVTSDASVPFDRRRVQDATIVTAMEIDRTLDVPYLAALPEVHDCLAATLAAHGRTQFHAAETEKYPHVTYFFNAKFEAPFPGETRELVASPKVATYDLAPDMSARPLTEAVVRRLAHADDDLVLVNFANPDMVGHTGDLSATIQAVETTDACLGQVVDAVVRKGGAALVVADHGNAERMMDDLGAPYTAHTTNDVPAMLIGVDVGLRERGILGDVAPTILELMGLPVPAAMTGRSLVSRG